MLLLESFSQRAINSRKGSKDPRNINPVEKKKLVHSCGREAPTLLSSRSRGLELRGTWSLNDEWEKERIKYSLGKRNEVRKR